MLIKGWRFVIKAERSVAISGSCPVTPPINPPTMPPTNPPRAAPIFSNNPPPSSTSQFSPGICARAPTAAKTNASSAITAPIATTPAIAIGVTDTTPARPCITAVMMASAIEPFRSSPASIFPSASANPEKKPSRTFTPA